MICANWQPDYGKIILAFCKKKQLHRLKNGDVFFSNGRFLDMAE